MNARPSNLSLGLDLDSTTRPGGDEMRTAEAATLLVFNRSGHLPPLVLVRSWNTEITQHQALAACLGHEQPIYSIAQPTGDEPDAYPDSIAKWVEHAEKVFCALDLPGPIYLGGWSFGGVVAFEMAERALDRGQDVALILLHDTCLPKSDARRRPGGALHLRLGRLGANLVALSEIRGSRDRRQYVSHHLKRAFKRNRRALIERLRHGGRRLPRVARDDGPLDESMWTTSTGERMTHLRRAVQVSYIRYQPTRGRVPIALLTTLESRKRFDSDITLGWSKVLDGNLETSKIPGGHHSMYETPHIEVVAAETTRLLRQARDRIAAPG
jgi:thioesterase domain-containing protein